MTQDAGTVRNDDAWWYCLIHQEVERGVGCANSERLGPYETREQAEAALATAAERTEQWDSDPRWADDD